MSDLVVLMAWLQKVERALERARKEFGVYGPHMVAMSHLQASMGFLEAVIEAKEMKE